MDVLEKLKEAQKTHTLLQVAAGAGLPSLRLIKAVETNVLEKDDNTTLQDYFNKTGYFESRDRASKK